MMFYGKARHLFRICHDGVWLISKPDSEDFGEPLPWQQCNSNLTFSPRTRAPSDPEACGTFGMVTPGLQSPSASVVLPTCYPERSNKETCYLFTRQIKQANIIVNWKISSKTKTNKNSGKKQDFNFSDITENYSVVLAACSCYLPNTKPQSGQHHSLC